MYDWLRIRSSWPKLHEHFDNFNQLGEDCQQLLLKS